MESSFSFSQLILPVSCFHPYYGLRGGNDDVFLLSDIDLLSKPLDFMPNITDEEYEESINTLYSDPSYQAKLHFQTIQNLVDVSALALGASQGQTFVRLLIYTLQISLQSNHFVILGLPWKSSNVLLSSIRLSVPY